MFPSPLTLYYYYLYLFKRKNILGLGALSTVKQIQVVAKVKLKPATTWLQVWRPDDSATLHPSMRLGVLIKVLISWITVFFCLKEFTVPSVFVNFIVNLKDHSFPGICLNQNCNQYSQLMPVLQETINNILQCKETGMTTSCHFESVPTFLWSFKSVHEYMYIHAIV